MGELPPGQSATPHQNVSDPRRQSELRLHVRGLCLALLLMVIPFGSVHWASLPRAKVLVLVLVSARCFRWCVTSAFFYTLAWPGKSAMTCN